MAVMLCSGRVSAGLSAHLLVLTGVLLLTALTGLHAMLCRECEPDTCRPIGLADCPGGVHKDFCDCCMVCAKQEDEACGGSYDILGQCDSGLLCQISPVFGQPITGTEEGVCKKCTPQYEGCNIQVGECVCNKECSPDAFTYTDRLTCEEKLKQVGTTSRCEEVKCPQSANEELVCPPDSIALPTVVTHDGCCHESQGCTCRPQSECPAILCSPGLSSQIVTKATNTPGRCCDIIDCVNATESTPPKSECNYEGEVHSNGDSWKPDKCTTCYCENGLTFCSAVQCVHPPNCAWLTHPDGECCPTCLGCVGEDGSLHNNSDVWQQDECTTCRCEAGQAYCQSTMCDVHCPHPIKVPGRCCGVCDEEHWRVLLPEECPLLANCTILCPNGLDMDDSGCYICQCKSECTLHCEHGYRIDKYGTELCECVEAPNNCRSMDWCTKQCMHGFRKDKNGCPKCRCSKCPQFECTKDCPFGYERSDKGCKLCKCLGESAVTTASPTFLSSTLSTVTLPPVAGRPCLSVDGRSLEEGQSWFDGCRQCYCHNGHEMCALITCPVPKCHNPIIRLGDCCPTCLEDTSIAPVSGPAACNASDGTYHAEGDTWRLDQCTRCVCHHGGILCDIESCPPVLCNHPVQMPNKCCPVCPHTDTVFPASKEHHPCVSSSGTVYSDGDMWRTNACQSCTCRNGQVLCFSQTCPLLSCKKTILKKGQCCPYCLDAKPSLTCAYGSDVYGPGETWLGVDCQKCVCDAGHAMCTQLTCPKLQCHLSEQIPGKCCPTCPDTSGSTPHTTVEIHTTWSNGGKTGTAFTPGEAERHALHVYLIWICVLAAILMLLIILVLVLVCYIRRQRRRNTIPTLLSRSPYRTEVKVRPKSTNLDLQGGCPLPTKQSNCETNNVRMSDLQYMRCSLGDESEKMQKDNFVCLSSEKDSNLAKQV